MAKARYSIHVPNHARQVALAAHHYLTNGPIRGIGTATLSYGHPHDSLHVIGEESPELDSHMKQTGTFIGDVANVPYIDVVKHGKNIAHWQMFNPHYQPQQMAAPQALAGSPEAMLPSSHPGQAAPSADGSYTDTGYGI